MGSMVRVLWIYFVFRSPDQTFKLPSGWFFLQEEELGEAIALYETNLAAIKDTLQVGGDEPDPEMGQLQADLEQALTDAQAALADITTSKSLHQYPEADGHFIEQSLASGRSRRPNNAKIHPRSRYATEEPDFAALAQTHPSLQPFLIVRQTAILVDVPYHLYIYIINKMNCILALDFIHILVFDYLSLAFC